MENKTMTTDEFLRTHLSGGTALIMRGAPGSGKSTFVKKVKDALNGAAWVFSADDNRMVDGKYVYKPEDNGKVHAWCLRDFTRAVSYNDYSDRLERLRMPQETIGQADHSAVNTSWVMVCDNTNIQPWEAAPYVAVARAFGWRPIVVTVMADPAVAGPRNLHGVPQKKVAEMARSCQQISLPGAWTQVIIKD